jgi:hypothetical protein
VNGALAALPVLVVGMALALTPAAPSSPSGPEVVFRFDGQVTESSGLVDLGDRVLTVNDSGDDAVVYVVDPRTGDTVGRTTYAEEVTDVEAVTTGPDGHVWVGDIGDNARSRTAVTLHRIEPPREGDRRVESTTYDLVYRGGARDAEALLVSPRGRVHVVSKGFLGGQVWQAPSRLRQDKPNVLTPIGDADGLVTDGAWSADGRHVVLRTYDDAVVYDVTDEPWRRVGSVRLPHQKQGEGLALRPDGTLLISSEGTRKPVLQVSLPDRLGDRMTTGPEDGASDGGDGTTGEGVTERLNDLVGDESGPRRGFGAVLALLALAVIGRALFRMRRRG